VIDAARAKRIKLVGLDVDGVLTDNGIIVAVDQGRRIESKRFHALDGVAIHFLRKAGIEVAWVSGRTSEATTARAAELKVTEVIQDAGMGMKLPAVRDLLARKQLEFADLAFVGDDLADIPVLRRAGLPVAVANAVAEAKSVAAWVTPSRGGEGAVREFVEALLRARGEWDGLLAQYLKERGDADD
jgi:3-deoxy-D-manno-octulosonate 8-phosphate phosphatase (KDO 8-P phosphatase)